MARKPDSADSLSVRLSDLGVYWICWGATAIALASSYRGLYDFATQRGQVPGWAAVAWPFLLDSFLVVGELRLFSATARNEGLRIKLWAGLLAALGLSASLAGNVAHVAGGPWGAKLAAAAAPLAAAVSLGTGLGIVKLNARKDRKADKAEHLTGDVSTDPARQPGKRTSAPRRKGTTTTPTYAQLAALAAQDEQDHKPMTRRQFAARHDISAHQARVFLAGQQNGGGK